MKKSHRFTLTGLLCLCMAILLLSGCNRKIPPTLSQPTGTPEQIYLQAVSHAEAGHHFDAFLSFNSIRDYSDASYRADYHLRKYTLEKLYEDNYDEVLSSVLWMNHDDPDNHKVVLICAERILAEGSKDDLSTVKQLLNMIGHPEELERMQQELYSSQLQRAIIFYRSGLYDEAFDILFDIPSEYGLRDVYYEMSFFHMQNTHDGMIFKPLSLLRDDIDSLVTLMNMLMECVDDPEFSGCREDIIKTLAHPTFDLVRLFNGGEWQCGDYYITARYDPADESRAVVDHNLPKDYFPEISGCYTDFENGVAYFCNKNNGEVFTLLGFSSDELRPDEMYIRDSLGNELTFTPYDSSAISAADADL